MKLGEIPAPKGATHRKKRRGFGESSGHGKTSGRGIKGQRARSGPGLRPEFEGGQMPLARRVPKRGFVHLKRTLLEIVNLRDLNRFPAASVVDPAVLAEAGLIRSKQVRVKILGDGSLAHPLTVKAHQFSKSALEKIKNAQGACQQF
ncbi:MAG: 50S ribosomal protein L15 [Candidatus Omnitrophica bacterium]|nr:50S ribosomal protein L15 [Candidatus Omnitrophota bacterium]